MPEILIQLAKKQNQRLNELAQGLGILPEELARQSVEWMLNRGDAQFEAKLARVRRRTPIPGKCAGVDMSSEAIGQRLRMVGDFNRLSGLLLGGSRIVDTH
ncbi:MAG: hypothetical protein M5U26_15215 [Planctomycetota bacterium]|nr:hypothetical protein [Planctomycetota bacterium]